eukprot:4622903-Prymnesium_polylepis.1
MNDLLSCSSGGLEEASAAGAGASTVAATVLTSAIGAAWVVGAAMAGAGAVLDGGATRSNLLEWQPPMLRRRKRHRRSRPFAKAQANRPRGLADGR